MSEQNQPTDRLTVNVREACRKAAEQALDCYYAQIDQRGNRNMHDCITDEYAGLLTPLVEADERAANLLTNLVQIIDVVKGEWAASWSHWDQEQRDGITNWLTSYYERRAALAEIEKAGKGDTTE